MQFNIEYYENMLSGNMFKDDSLDVLLSQPRLKFDAKTSVQYRKAVQAKAFIQQLEEKAKRIANFSNGFVSSQSNFMHSFSASVMGNNSTFANAASGSETSLSLDDFLSRPVSIEDFNLTSGSEQIIRPWEDWSSDQTVRAKLRNYHFLKGTLELTFVVSSSPMHYGTVIFSHQPYPESNPVYETYKTYGSNESFLCYLSQSPEVTYLKLGQDKEATLRIPLLLPKACARLNNAARTEITPSTGFSDLFGISEVFVKPLFFGDSSPVPEDITVHVYARLVDYELGPPTGTPFAVSESQPLFISESDINSVRESVKGNEVVSSVAKAVSNQVSDEYSESGPLTQIASAVSNVTASLSNVPFIGVAAKATSMATKVGAKFLNFFGFSRPAQLEAPLFYKRILFNNGAVTETRDTAFKLSVDPKQELSLEPLGGEDKVDPLSIPFLCAREAYIGQFRFEDTSTPLSSDLAVFPINPYYSVGGSDIRALTPMAMCSLPFSYWRGSITFRFEIQCSAFARGKFLIIYEPNGDMGSVIVSRKTHLNKQYMSVVDIAEDRNVEVTVNYQNDKLVSRCDKGGFVSMETYDIDTILPNILVIEKLSRENRNNGYLSIRPFTEFVDPHESTDCVINVFVRSDDMEFSAPRAISPIAPKMTLTGLDDPGLVISESMVTHEDNYGDLIKYKGNVRQTCSSFQINQTSNSSEDVYLYHFGERINSFRSLLKRDHVNFRYEFNASFTFPHFPVSSAIRGGNNDGNIDGILLTENLFNFLRFNFLFMKGGYRHRMLFATPTSARAIVSRRADVGNDLLPTGAGFPVDNQGAVIFDTPGQGVEVELPYYFENQYQLTSNNPTDTDDASGPLLDTPGGGRVDFYGAVSPQEVVCFSSAAEDFTFFRFQGARWIKSPGV